VTIQLNISNGVKIINNGEQINIWSLAFYDLCVCLFVSEVGGCLNVRTVDNENQIMATRIAEILQFNKCLDQ